MNKRQQFYYDQLKEIIEGKGGKLLSDEYINSRTKVELRCNKSHTWKSKPDHIKGNRWCPYCSGKMKLTIEEMHRLARERGGGKCLSDKYLGSRSNLLWECEFGHRWEARPDSIKYKNCWCPRCSADAKKLTIEEMHRLAQERVGGKCLSTEYVNMHSNLLWECGFGHKWAATPTSIKHMNSWCPICRSSKGEHRCSDVLTKLDIKFITEYADPRQSNRRYDFRFVIGENHYLIEYDGIQHFEYVPFFHTSQEHFEERRQADVVKTKFTMKYGYKLIRIDYNELDRIEFHIREAIKDNKDLYLSNPDMYDWLNSALLLDDDNSSHPILNIVTPLKIIIVGNIS